MTPHQRVSPLSTTLAVIICLTVGAIPTTAQYPGRQLSGARRINMDTSGLGDRFSYTSQGSNPNAAAGGKDNSAAGRADSTSSITDSQAAMKKAMEGFPKIDTKGGFPDMGAKGGFPDMGAKGGFPDMSSKNDLMGNLMSQMKTKPKKTDEPESKTDAPRKETTDDMDDWTFPTVFKKVTKAATATRKPREDRDSLIVPVSRIKSGQRKLEGELKRLRSNVRLMYEEMAHQIEKMNSQINDKLYRSSQKTKNSMKIMSLKINENMQKMLSQLKH